MAPAFAEAAIALEPRVRLAKLNTDEAQALAGRLNIRSIPTLILFSGGKEIARQSGVLPAREIERWVESQLKTAA
jgi:thioredoxin 2